MKLVPENHSDAISWVSQAWHRVFLTPAETGDMLAVICGFEDWDELSLAISKQNGKNPPKLGITLLSQEIIATIDGSDWIEIRKRQGEIMASRFEMPDEVRGPLIHSYLESLFILDLPTISATGGEFETPLLETLRSLHVDRKSISNDEVDEEQDETPFVDHHLIPSIEPLRYSNFCKAMGWKTGDQAVMPRYIPYHPSFDLADMHGVRVPCFILRMGKNYGLGGETLEFALESIIHLVRGMGLPRAIAFSSLPLGAKDDEGNILTSLGFIILANAGGFQAMNVAKKMKTIDAVFDLNDRFAKQQHLRADFGSPMPDFLIDKDGYVAKLFYRYVPPSKDD